MTFCSSPIDRSKTPLLNVHDVCAPSVDLGAQFIRMSQQMSDLVLRYELLLALLVVAATPPFRKEVWRQMIHIDAPIQLQDFEAIRSEVFTN